MILPYVEFRVESCFVSHPIVDVATIQRAASRVTATFAGAGFDVIMLET